MRETAGKRMTGTWQEAGGADAEKKNSKNAGEQGKGAVRMGRVLVVVGAFLILAAAGLTCFNLREDRSAGQEAEAVLARVEAQTPGGADGTDAPGDSADSAIAGQALPDGAAARREMKTVDVDGRSYIGTLSIPALSLELPVMSSWSYPNLRIAPCRYQGSVYENNLILLAHNYATHFGRLKTLPVGSEVLFTDVDGNGWHYQITELTTLGAYDTDKMVEGKWDLTLFTCTPGGRQRVTVRCVRAQNGIVAAESRSLG